MSTASHVSDVLRIVLTAPTDGVVGVVDDLLAACREHSLEIDWRGESCRIRSAGGEWETLRDLSVRKSVFRAIIARVAAICNEQNPNSVSPYGGDGTILVRPAPPLALHVTFANTAAEQRLAISIAANRAR
jgi:hypothetical protein